MGSCARYEIYVRLSSGDLVWVETAESIEQARSRLAKLASIEHRDYALFDTEASGFVKSSNDAGEMMHPNRQARDVQC